MKKMGAKAKKSLPDPILKRAQENDFGEMENPSNAPNKLKL